MDCVCFALVGPHLQGIGGQGVKTWRCIHGAFALWSMSMPLCKEGIDICGGEDHTCKGISRAIMLKPTDKKRKSLLRKI